MPGLRGLLGAHRAPAPHARAGRQAGEPGVRQRHRLLEPLPVLHEHLRRAQHPRPRAGGRDRHRGRPSRPRRVGGDRRRRRALDRGQPPDPRAAPERELHDPAVQQPDLRPDQGSVLADERAREGHEELAVRLARPPVQPDLGRARRRGHVRRPHPRHGPQAHAGGVPARARAQGRGVRRDLPELQRLQRRCVLGDPHQGQPARDADRAAATASRSASARTRTRACGSTSTARRRSSTSPTSARTRC